MDRETTNLQELEAQKQDAQDRLEEMEQQKHKLEDMLNEVRQKCKEESQLVRREEQIISHNCMILQLRYEHVLQNNNIFICYISKIYSNICLRTLTKMGNYFSKGSNMRNLNLSHL